MSNPQLSSKADGETDRCGAICNKQHIGAVELENVQKQSSNPLSPMSIDEHTFRPAFIPQSHKKLARFFHSSLTPLLPKVITNKYIFRSQHRAMSPSMLFRKQPRSWGFFRNTPPTVWTRPVESLRTTPTSFNLLAPNQERWWRKEFCRTRTSRATKCPKSRTILARSSITGEESLEEHGVLPR